MPADSLPVLPAAPEPRRLERTLKDGYWDRTEIVGLADGSQRVRKRSKQGAGGPWGVRSLRREIGYLRSLAGDAQAVFPSILAAWDDEREPAPDVGYEMPFFADHVDAGDLARRAALPQAEADALQDALAEALLARVHQPMATDESLATHVRAIVAEALTGLEADATLAPLIRAEHITLNGAPAWGTRAAFARIARESDALDVLDRGPCVRLHGDFFLENILWRPRTTSPTREAPQLLLVDPVSVAGVWCGPAVFDLVKYESYATGELLALRSEWVDVAGFDGSDRYTGRIRWDDPALRPFQERNWHARFRRAFEVRHGRIDRRLYRLIDGYFSAAMALNTSGLQRRARLLKATAEFNAVLTGG